MIINKNSVITVPETDEDGILMSAAGFLSQYINKITGMELNITRTESSGNFILLGETDESTLVSEANVPDGHDSFGVKAYSKETVFQGNSGRGVIYAVFAFLEFFGCRFYAEDTEFVPQIEKLEIPNDLTISEKPSFDYRDLYWSCAYDEILSLKLRLNGGLKNQAKFGRTISSKFGGAVEYAGPHFVHTMGMMVPASEYFESHPEYFSEINGERNARYLYSQLCMTNDDVLRIVTDKTREWLRQNPDRKIVSVSQNDSFVIECYCTCDKCKKIIEEEGSPAGPLIRFVNKVAEEIEKDFPDVMVDTLAYQYSVQPPKITKPRKNVCVRLCTGGCYSHPIELCERNASIKTAFEEWNRICDNLYVWDYTTDFMQYLSPEPNLKKIPADIRFYKKHGVKGVFMQGAYQNGKNAEFAELRCYIMAKLLWNTETDETKAADEFINAYYGPAAPFIKQYLEFIYSKAQNEHLPVFFQSDDFWGPLTTEDDIKLLDKIWNDAEIAVAGDEKLLAHVKRSELCHKWNKVDSYRRNGASESEKKAAEDALYLECIALGVERINEGANVPRPDLAN